MRAKFRHDSDEEICGAGCHHRGVHGLMACMRRAGHEGKHIALVRDAARADGVRHCCRIPLLSNSHRPDCFTLEAWNKPGG